MVTPLTNLTTAGGRTGFVRFLLRRKNKIVVLQWETFSGQIGAAGVAFLTVMQTVCNMPPYKINAPYRIIYAGTARMSFIEVDPAANENIKFYLDISGTANADTVKVGDQVEIMAGSITWIAA
jgi:hypothetical protein